MKLPPTFDNLEGLLNDVQKLKEAHATLENVWGEVGPYGTGKLSETTLFMLRRFFNWDDSE